MGRGEDHPGLATNQAEYAAQAAAYDRRWARYARITSGYAAGALPLSAGPRVLDVGCGSGQLLGRLIDREPGLKLTGVDASAPMLGQARRRLGERASLVLGDAQRLPLADGCMDAVASVSLLHFLPEPRRALSEWNRVLKPGGHLLVADWSATYPPTRLIDWWAYWTGRSAGRTWRPAALGQLLAGLGLVDLQQAAYSAGWQWRLFQLQGRKPEAG